MEEYKKELVEEKDEINAVLQVTVECIAEFSKNLTANINSKGVEWLDKSVVTEKSDTFPSIPEIVNVTTIGVWEDAIKARVLTVPWDIKGLSIINIPHVDDLSGRISSLSNSIHYSVKGSD